MILSCLSKNATYVCVAHQDCAVWLAGVHKAFADHHGTESGNFVIQDAKPDRDELAHRMRRNETKNSLETQPNVAAMHTHQLIQG